MSDNNFLSNFSISFSLSMINLFTTDCTLPADSDGFTAS